MARRILTTQSLVLLLSAPWRLQGTPGALHAHLETSETGSGQGTTSTKRAPGPPQKSRLEIISPVEEEKLFYRGAVRVTASEVLLQAACCV